MSEPDLIAVKIQNPKYREPDPVNHPPHYGGDTVYEAIKVIEAWQLGFRLGNVLKYIRRNGDKGDRLQNLQKARWYLDREIQHLETAALSDSMDRALEASTRTSDPNPQPFSIQKPKDEFTEFKS
jgi:hypothetical protein